MKVDIDLCRVRYKLFVTCVVSTGYQYGVLYYSTIPPPV
jgi:hypothetical protein